MLLVCDQDIVTFPLLLPVNSYSVFVEESDFVVAVPDLKAVEPTVTPTEPDIELAPDVEILTAVILVALENPLVVSVIDLAGLLPEPTCCPFVPS